MNPLSVSTIRELMRFWLSIFLMVFLPLQSAWAAAAPYCGHENSVPVTHFGHHVHKHHTADFAKDSSNELAGVAVSGGIDVDCTPCHGVCMAMVSNLSSTGSFTTKTSYAIGVASESPLPPLQRPERPKWQRLA